MLRLLLYFHGKEKKNLSRSGICEIVHGFFFKQVITKGTCLQDDICCQKKKKKKKTVVNTFAKRSELWVKSCFKHRSYQITDINQDFF